MNKSFKKYKLKDVVNFFDGFAFSKNDMQEKGEFHFIKITNLINGKVELDNFKISKPNNYKKENILKGNEILIAMSGSTGKTSFNEYENVLVNQRISILRPKELLVSSRYLRHLLVNKNFETYCNNLGTGQQKNISKNDIGSFEVSIPPMEVQNEIVEVLDKFSALEAELEAELEARTKQYEYYKSKLIFSENKRLILSKLSRYSNTRISSEELTFSNYVGVDNLLQSKLGKVNSKYEPMIGSQTEYVAGDILIGNIRPYLRKIWYSDIRGGANGDVLVIRVLPKMKNVIMDKFLYYVLSSEEFFYYMDATSKGAKMPRGDKNMIMQFEIPIPPLEEQERIVSILDKFSTLVTNIKEGLPAEIELRRKQYEYYRNKLLTFDKE